MFAFVYVSVDVVYYVPVSMLFGVCVCVCVCVCEVLSMYGVCVCVFDTTYSSMLWWNQVHVCSVEVPLCVCVLLWFH